MGYKVKHIYGPEYLDEFDASESGNVPGEPVSQPRIASDFVPSDSQTVTMANSDDLPESEVKPEPVPATSPKSAKLPATSKGTTLADRLGPDSMPREKLMKNGAHTLSNQELMAILLRTGTQGCNVMDLAHDILREFDDSLVRMSGVGYKKLSSLVKGMGDAKAVTIVAALELGRRMAHEKPDEIFLKDAERCYEYFRPIIAHLDHEEFHLAVLDNRLKLICEKMIFKGGLTNTVVDIRILLRTVIEYGGTRFVVAHNHPAGTPKPSSYDIELTKGIEAAAATLDLKMVDHIIIPKGAPSLADAGDKKTYFSFHNDGDK